ncbi:MAG: hypothetical protein HYV07_16545 [Deltaproteobacteria bacterium]|nr:hypothetical protein [Deltaproteobacteria bacterium]
MSFGVVGCSSAWARAIAPALVTGCVLVARVALADESGPRIDPSERPPAARSAPQKEGMPELVTECSGSEEFGGTELERGGYCLALSEKYVSLRTVVGRALELDPGSFRAQYLAGVAQHLGEGNLPKALAHLHRAEELFVAVHGQRPGDRVAEGPFSVLRRILLELVYVHGEMDQHEEKIRYVDLLRDRLGYDYDPLKAWPLMKLERWSEARRVAQDAIDRTEEVDGYWRAVGLTAMCAIESEQRHREKSYDACKSAAEEYLVEGSLDGGVALSNAAAAATEMGYFDEAERLLTEATRRNIEGTINPWGRLTQLYLRQGRFGEALSALREMKAYRMGRPSYFDQQDQTDAELTGASVLIVAGLVEDAARITGRAVHRPDRQGTSSAAFEQNYGGALLLDRTVRLDLARRLREQASYSSFSEALKLRARAAELAFGAWLNARKVASIVASRDRLSASLRPECPGSLELPNWLDGELIAVVGPGVALESIERSVADEALPEATAAPIFAALRAEAFLLGGDDEAALREAKKAVEKLTPEEALLRARAAAIGAEAARREGLVEEATALYARALGSDPGVFRRLGFVLPVRLEASPDSDAAHRAVELLESSPLFELDSGGLLLAVGDTSVSLALPDGSQLLTAPVQAGKPDPDALARRIAAAAHQDLLVPNVDVTQADVRSLDGGLTGGGRASERAKSILDEVLGDPAEP